MSFTEADRPDLLRVLALHDRLIPKYLAERSWRKYHRELDRRRAAIAMLRETGLTREDLEMCTKYPDIWQALSEPFSGKEIKTLKKGKTISYVTARTVMNRLDTVIGPENWWDEYTPQPTCVICKLTLRLPAGEEVCKSDAGGHAGMSDEGDDEKSGYSDAFKRAAVKFGIGRHLYEDGIPDFMPEKPGPGESVAPVIPADYQGPQTNKEFMEYMKSIDPDGTNGARTALVQWGEGQGFPGKVGKWSDSQSISGYLFVADWLERESAK